MCEVQRGGRHRLSRKSLRTDDPASGIKSAPLLGIASDPTQACEKEFNRPTEMVVMSLYFEHKQEFYKLTNPFEIQGSVAGIKNVMHCHCDARVGMLICCELCASRLAYHSCSPSCNHALASEGFGLSVV